MGRRVSKPKISAIIPVFNKKEYVESCINSLFQKEYENLEVISLNDVSEDGSDSILHTCARNDSRVRVFSHKVNSGASVARNTGISLQTEYNFIVKYELNGAIRSIYKKYRYIS